MKASGRGRAISEESKVILRAAALGRKLSEETKGKMAASKLGSKHSEETRAKIRGAALNKTEEHKAKLKAANGMAVIVSAPNIETNETTEYPSISEAARAFHCVVSVIRYNKNKIQKPYRGKYLFLLYNKNQNKYIYIFI